MKYILLIFSLLSVTIAQEPILRCQYILSGGLRYTCFMTLINPNGLNNFTEIEGTHLVGYTDADVIGISTFSGGGDISSNLPRIICDTFNNLDSIDLYSIGLRNIDDTSFSGCPKVTFISFYTNRITSISDNAFSNLPQLSSLILENNLLTSLPTNVFTNQHNLTWLSLGINPFEDIPANLFRPLKNLDHLSLVGANITTINREWFTANSKLNSLFLNDNAIYLSANSFLGLEQLTILRLRNNGINSIPVGAFALLPNLKDLELSWNRLNTLRRNGFGVLTNLLYLDLSGNVVNSLDRAIIDDAVNLDSLFFRGNLCADGSFTHFQNNRPQHLLMLESCFLNVKNSSAILSNFTWNP